MAAYRDHLEITQLLLEHGADVNLQNGWGEVPLHRTFPSRQLSSFWARLDPAPFSFPCSHARAGASVRYFLAPLPPFLFSPRSLYLWPSLCTLTTGFSSFMLGCLRWRKRFITFSTTTGPSTPLSRLSPMPMLGLVPSVRHLFPAPLLPLLSSRYLYLWPLLHPLTTAFSSFLGACPNHPRSGISYRKCPVTFSVTTILACCSFLSSPHLCYTPTTAFSLFLAACCITPTLRCLCYIL
jgi:hypothetical protein